MPVLEFTVRVELESLESNLPQDRLIEYIRVGIHNAILRESRCIGLLPPGAASQREVVRTEFTGLATPERAGGG